MPSRVCFISERMCLCVKVTIDTFRILCMKILTKERLQKNSNNSHGERVDVYMRLDIVSSA